MTLREEQIQNEEKAKTLAENKEFRELTKAIEQGRFEETSHGNNLMTVMFPPVEAKIAEYLATTYKGHTGKTQRYVKLLSDDSKEISYILLKVLVAQIAKFNNLVKLSSLSTSIISTLKRLHYFNRLEKDNPKLHSYLGSEYKRASAARKEMLVAKHIKRLYDLEDEGNDINDVKAGAQLLEIVLLSGLDIIVKTRRRLKGSKAHYYISFTDEVMALLTTSSSLSMPMLIFKPMIVPPNDWTSLTKGGYLTHKVGLVKVRKGKNRRAIENEDFSKIYPVVNKLQRTAWKVNTRVYDVITTVFDGNMIDPRSPPTLPRCYGNIPSLNVPKAEDLVGYREYKKNATVEEKAEWAIWNRKRELTTIGIDGEKGRRLQFLITMSMVKSMVGYEKFYYVYQLDYRGRVYPNTDFFNPQSKGYVKAMLEFDEGHYLTKEGEKWLNIHAANCYGMDKEPFDDRIRWAYVHRTNMMKVAKDPMGTLKYWTMADSPYEFLAACFAMEDFIKGKRVHLPIQLDAVNSGVQFYSGLLMDAEGAESCCVIGNKRSDLYSMVADSVNEKLTNGEYPKLVVFKDSEGVEKTLPTRIEGESLKGKVTRSMTKPNVMTVPYSVTLRGMKLQNWDVMDKLRQEGKVFWQGDEWIVNYLFTQLNYESIFEIVKGARLGQQYLKEVAGLLEGTALWHTPIFGFPVRQLAFKRKEFRVKTPLGTLSIRIGTDELSKQKQLNGIAANYIHSIDSTLLLYCVKNMSGDIGVIHDCFLVHPNNGEEIRTHYKNGYVEIMRGKPLKQLSKELDPEGKVEIPYVNTLDLDDVYDSEYIIS